MLKCSLVHEAFVAVFTDAALFVAFPFQLMIVWILFLWQRENLFSEIELFKSSPFFLDRSIQLLKIGKFLPFVDFKARSHIKDFPVLLWDKRCRLLVLDCLSLDLLVLLLGEFFKLNEALRFCVQLGCGRHYIYFVKRVISLSLQSLNLLGNFRVVFK